MKHTAEMGSGATIYLRSKFRKDYFSHSKADGEGEGCTDMQTER
jgi:hypothetical protein